MDPFTIAAITFGVQKLRGKSTNRALRDGIFAGTLGQGAAMTSAGQSMGLNTLGQAGSIGGTAIGKGISGLFTPGATQATGTIAANSPFAAGQAGAAATSAKGFAGMTDPGTMQGLVGNEGNFLSKLIPKTTAGKVGAGMALTSLLGGDEDPQKSYLPIPNQYYSKYANSGAAGTPTGFMTRDYATGTNSPLVEPGEFTAVEDILGDQPTQEFKEARFNQGGIANIRKFNEGGLGQMLPSKHSHSENDANNYTRAGGFVKDGAGMGDDNEDTMLAQLADGEFVSRSAAVRGAGIIAGADLSNKEDQRKKGAEFFYEQQKRFKRIMDILDASKNNASSVH